MSLLRNCSSFQLSERDLVTIPLFQVAFRWTTRWTMQKLFPALTFVPFEIDTRNARFDFNLTISEVSKGLAGSLEYNSDLFDGPLSIA